MDVIKAEMMNKPKAHYLDNRLIISRCSVKHLVASSGEVAL